jgi:predicted N-acetyltransferase YhbS
VLVFTLAQTPEPEVHGEFVERLRERLDRTGWQLVLVLETATYRQRVGSEARVRERRATWERLLRDLQLTALDVA